MKGPSFVLLLLHQFVCIVFALEIPAAPLAGLKSEDFRKREAAQSELLAWSRERPEEAMEQFLTHWRVADDPEVRDRCQDILRELVSDLYLKDGEGFIGIRMQDEWADIPGDPKRRAVIRVAQLVPDAAAEKAGIQLNDLIAGLGDQTWHEGLASMQFTDKIRKMKPDTKVTLKVLRDGNLRDIEVTLGRRPLRADHLFETDEFIAAAERAEKEAYFRRWLEQRKARN
jgi:C-terminal processing protease CtpA/Prc